MRRCADIPDLLKPILHHRKPPNRTFPDAAEAVAEGDVDVGKPPVLSLSSLRSRVANFGPTGARVIIPLSSERIASDNSAGDSTEDT